MIPDQELYDKLFELSQGLGYKTFDYLPAEEEGYPFVYIGQTQELPQGNKFAYTGEMNVTLHVYGEMTNRKLVSDMKGNLLREIKRLKETPSFKWYYVDSASQPSMIPEQNTNQMPQHRPLWHAIIPITLKFIDKGAL
ncbi:hypothetical protein DTPHA_1401894 [Enterococcus faecium]|jgi:hypothetical protein|nr:hypothetical protein DTPHA_1401894 [Enterococcus faecium]DAI98834.1 MAG TPA: hypothetical protein [Caudoviricetes sp.]